MKKRILITAVVIAAIHLVLSISSVLVAFGSGMEAFENPDHEPSQLERVADQFAGILMQPGSSVWTPWMSKNMPNVVEWGLCLMNSMLWGIGLALILNAPALLKRTKSDNKAIEATS